MNKLPFFQAFAEHFYTLRDILDESTTGFNNEVVVSIVNDQIISSADEFRLPGKFSEVDIDHHLI